MTKEIAMLQVVEDAAWALRDRELSGSRKAFDEALSVLWRSIDDLSLWRDGNADNDCYRLLKVDVFVEKDGQFSARETGYMKLPYRGHVATIVARIPIPRIPTVNGELDDQP